MSKSNGNREHRQQGEVSLGHVEIEDVFLAGLVAVLQVCDTCDISNMERDALAFGAKVMNDALASMSNTLKAGWRERLVTTVLEAAKGRT